MPNDPDIGKLLEAFGIPDLTELLPPEAVAEVKKMLSEAGGVDAILANKAPESPPPRPNPAFGIPDPPIAAGLVEYRCFDDRDGVVTPVPSVVFTTRGETLADGTVAWRIKTSIDDHGIAVDMEALVRAADLRLILHQGGAWMGEFRHAVYGEHMYVRATRLGDAFPKGDRITLPEAAFPSLVTLWTALAAAPLHRQWSANVHLYSHTGPDEWRFVAVRLEVVDEERIETPAGAFDCWVVSAQAIAPDTGVTGRYWVSRGDPAMCVVARAHAGMVDGRTRRYEAARIERGLAPAGGAQPVAPTTPESPHADSAAPQEPTVDSPPPQEPADASMELVTRLERSHTASIRLRKGSVARLSVDNSRDDARHSVPTLESLRESRQVPPGTPPAALARYEREYAEFLEDSVAHTEMMNVTCELAERTIPMRAVVAVNGETPVKTWVRLTVPPPVRIRLSSESVRVDYYHQPLPLTAPLDQRRKRFVARLIHRTNRIEGAMPSEQYQAPDGSTIVIHGPAQVSSAESMTFEFEFVFDAWEDVAPFTVTYDISAEGRKPVQGKIYIGARRAEK